MTYFQYNGGMQWVHKQKNELKPVCRDCALSRETQRGAALPCSLTLWLNRNYAKNCEFDCRNDRNYLNNSEIAFLANISGLPVYWFLPFIHISWLQVTCLPWPHIPAPDNSERAALHTHLNTVDSNLSPRVYVTTSLLKLTRHKHPC